MLHSKCNVSRCTRENSLTDETQLKCAILFYTWEPMCLQRAIRCAATSFDISIQINDQQICLASEQTGENMPRTTLSHFYFSQCFLFLILRVDLLFCTVGPPSTPRSRLLFPILLRPIPVLIKSEMNKSTTVCHYFFELTKSSSLNMADKAF